MYQLDSNTRYYIAQVLPIERKFRFVISVTYKNIINEIKN